MLPRWAETHNDISVLDISRRQQQCYLTLCFVHRPHNVKRKSFFRVHPNSGIRGPDPHTLALGPGNNNTGACEQQYAVRTFVYSTQTSQQLVRHNMCAPTIFGKNINKNTFSSNKAREMNLVAHGALRALLGPMGLSPHLPSEFTQHLQDLPNTFRIHTTPSGFTHHLQNRSTPSELHPPLFC